MQTLFSLTYTPLSDTHHQRHTRAWSCYFKCQCSPFSVFCSALQLRQVYTHTLGWQWQHITGKPIMHFSLYPLLFPPFLWLSLLFYLSSLSVGSDFILLSLSVSLSLSSLSPASKIFLWLESNLLRERRWHRANANSVFLSESCWVCVSNRYENINQETCSKSTGLCRLVFGRNNCTLHPNSWPVKQEEEERKREGAEQGERDKERDQERR